MPLFHSLQNDNVQNPVKNCYILYYDFVNPRIIWVTTKFNKSFWKRNLWIEGCFPFSFYEAYSLLLLFVFVFSVSFLKLMCKKPWSNPLVICDIVFRIILRAFDLSFRERFLLFRFIYCHFCFSFCAVQCSFMSIEILIINFVVWSWWIGDLFFYRNFAFAVVQDCDIWDNWSGVIRQNCCFQDRAFVPFVY